MSRLLVREKKENFFIGKLNLLNQSKANPADYFPLCLFHNNLIDREKIYRVVLL